MAVFFIDGKCHNEVMRSNGTELRYTLVESLILPPNHQSLFKLPDRVGVFSHWCLYCDKSVYKGLTLRILILEGRLQVFLLILIILPIQLFKGCRVTRAFCAHPVILYERESPSFHPHVSRARRSGGCSHGWAVEAGDGLCEHCARAQLPLASGHYDLRGSYCGEQKNDTAFFELVSHSTLWIR